MMEDLLRSVATPINIWPIGMITPFSGDDAAIAKLKDEGWFPCDGAELAQTAHPRLFQILGYKCGGASPNFCVPDLRGVFIRGVDGEGAISRDPDAATRKSHTSDALAPNQVLSRQDTEIKGHGHVMPQGSQADAKAKARSPLMMGEHEYQRFDKAKAIDEIVTTETGFAESRGVNVSVNYIIFAGPAVKPAPISKL